MRVEVGSERHFLTPLPGIPRAPGTPRAPRAPRDNSGRLECVDRNKGLSDFRPESRVPKITQFIFCCSTYNEIEFTVFGLIQNSIKNTVFLQNGNIENEPRFCLQVALLGKNAFRSLKKTRLRKMFKNGIIKTSPVCTLKSPHCFANIRLRNAAKCDRECKGPARFPKRARFTKHQCA